MRNLRAAIGELMAKQEIDKELAATVILEAVFTTDDKACAKYGVSRRSLVRWRKALASDPVLSGVFTSKKAAFDKAWAEALPVSLRKGIELIGKAYDAIESDPLMIKNPNVISAVADAVKICSEVFFTSQIIDARIHPENRPADGLFGSDAATGSEDHAN